MAKIFLTHRALADLKNVFEYSKEKWGKSTADKYLNQFQDTFSLLRTSSGLLLKLPEISREYYLFLVGKHWLVCHLSNQNIFVVTVKHTSQNLLERLQFLQPTLEAEVEMLKSQISQE